jgi:hypothetical protein
LELTSSVVSLLGLHARAEILFTEGGDLEEHFYTEQLHLLDAGYLDQLGPLRKFVETSTKLTCLEISGYQIKYRMVLCLLELQIRHYLIGLATGTYFK